MATENRSEAYDLSLFEPREARRPQEQERNNVIELPRKQLERNARPKVRPLRALSTLLLSVAVIAVMGCMIYSQAELNELNSRLAEKTKTLTETQSSYTQMKMKSDAQLSLDSVENYAKEKLGMKKIEASQVVCVSLSEGDKGAVLRDDGNSLLLRLWDSLQNLLS